MSDQPRARVHLSGIAENWQALNARARGGQAGAVVKADAYGHGLAPVGRALAAAGCRHFFVASANEGETLRAALGPGLTIHVFNGVTPGTLAVCKAAGLCPVINTPDQLATWQAGAPGSAYDLHLDTAMNRLGLRADRLGDIASNLQAQPPALVMSHYACADDPDHPLNATQQARFRDLAAGFATASLSLANTAGHFLGTSVMPGEITRPGIGLYGGGTSPSRDIPLKPGLSLEAPILSVNHVTAGETVGYGATARLQAPATLATVALGYGDGFLRAAGNRGFGYIGATRCAIIGRVSMDLITLDVSAAKGLAKPGVLVEFLGPNANLEDQAALAGTLGYEFLSGLGHRVKRIHED